MKRWKILVMTFIIIILAGAGFFHGLRTPTGVSPKALGALFGFSVRELDRALSEVAERDFEAENLLGNNVLKTLSASILDENEYFDPYSFIKKDSRYFVSTLPKSAKRLQWEFGILNESRPLHFASPGGKIFVSKGLLLQLKSNDQLALFVAHNIAHVVLGHTSDQLESTRQALNNNTLAIISDLGMLQYSLSKETAADALAHELGVVGAIDPQTQTACLNLEASWRKDGAINTRLEASRKRTEKYHTRYRWQGWRKPQSLQDILESIRH